MELSTICRVCMQSIALEYIDLDTPFNEQTYFDCFNFCTGLNACASDHLPKTICISCASLMQTSYDFIQTASKTDELLRQSLVDYDTEIDNKLIVYSNNESIVLGEVIQKNEILSSPVDIESHVEQQQHDEPGNHESLTTHDDEFKEKIKKEDPQPNENKVIEIAKNICTTTDNQLSNTKQSFQIIDLNQLNNVFLNIPELTSLLPIETNKQQIVDGIRCYDWTEADPTEDGFLDEINIDALKDYESFETESENSIESKKLHKCEHCKDSFSTLNDLKQHNSQRHEISNDFWYCNLCGEALDSRLELTWHRNNDHQSKDRGLCITCGNSFTDVHALTDHVTKEHWSRKIPDKCPYCKKRFQMNSLAMHIRYKHADVVDSSDKQQFVCEYCLKVCQDAVKLKAHIKVHTAKKCFECEICGITLNTKKQFDKHKKQAHSQSNKQETDLRQCRRCHFTTNDENAFSSHMKHHYNQVHYEQILRKRSRNHMKEYLCAYCPKTFAYIKMVKDHEDFYHGEKQSACICDICGKKFLTNTRVRAHKKTAHSKNRPFFCNICPKAFKLKGMLTRHLKDHTEKNIACAHCDKKFSLPCYLRVHMRTHTNEKPYECHLCDQKFAMKVRLSYHLANHKGILRECEFCSEKFKNVAKLRIHRFEHIGYPFVCDICGENYHRRIGFTRHMRRAHGKIFTDADIDENRNRNIRKFYRNNESNNETQTKNPEPNEKPSLGYEKEV